MTPNRKIQVAALAVFANGLIALTVMGSAQAGLLPSDPCWYCWLPTGNECLGHYQTKAANCNDINVQQKLCTDVETLQQQPVDCCPQRYGAPKNCKSLGNGMIAVDCQFMGGTKVMGPGGPGHKK